MASSGEFDLNAGPWRFHVENSVGGIVLGYPDYAVIAMEKGRISFLCPDESLKAEIGRYDGNVWIRESDAELESKDGKLSLEIKAKQVVRLVKPSFHEVVATPSNAFLEVDVFGRRELPIGHSAVAAVKVVAIKDIADGELSLSAPEGWRVKPGSCAIKVLKAGESTECRFEFAIPPSVQPLDIFRLSASLCIEGKPVAQSGLMIQTAKPFEATVENKVWTDSRGKAAVHFDVINRIDVPLSGKIVWRGDGLSKDVETNFTAPAFSRSVFESDLQVSKTSSLVGTLQFESGKESVSLETRAVLRFHDLTADSWHFEFDPKKKGESEGWQSPKFDDSKWLFAKVPYLWECQGFDSMRAGLPERGPYVGHAWYRVKFRTMPLAKGRHLSLLIGAIDDADVTYFNGRKIGETSPNSTDSSWKAERCYPIPDDCVKHGGGENVISINVNNCHYDGGLWKGPVCIILQ